MTASFALASVRALGSAIALAAAMVPASVGHADVVASVAVGIAGDWGGDFEAQDSSGLPRGWSVEAPTPSGAAKAIRDPGVAHNGGASLRIDNTNPASVTVVSEPVTLRVGHVYRLSAWLRTENVAADPAARYPTAVPACLSMASFPFTNHSPTVGATRDWTAVTMLFVATRASDRVRLHLGWNGTATGSAWFDDVSVSEVTDVAEFVPLETVRWADKGFRTEQGGWTLVHVEGEPYARGYQHGYLLATEIAAYIQKLATLASGKDPANGWSAVRTLADATMLRGFSEELLTEMRGIRRRRRQGRCHVRRPGARLPRHRDDQRRHRRRLPQERTQRTAACPDGEELPDRRGGARDPGGPAQMLGARRHRPGDGRWTCGLRADLHVERLHGRALQRAARPGAEHGTTSRLPDLPRRHPFGHGLLHQRCRHRRRRNHGGADALEPGRGADERSHPAGGAVRDLDRRGRGDPRRAQQRPLHQRLADGRHQDRRSGGMSARYEELRGVAHRRRDSAVRDTGLSMGEQQRPRSGSAQRVRRATQGRAVRPGVRAVEPRHRLQRLLRARARQDRRAVGGAAVRDVADQPGACLRRQDHDVGDGSRTRLLGASGQGDVAREVPRARQPPHAGSAGRTTAPEPRLHRGDADLARREAGRGQGRGTLRAVGAAGPAELEVAAVQDRLGVDKKTLWTGTLFPASAADHWLASGTAGYWQILNELPDAEAKTAGTKSGASDAHGAKSSAGETKRGVKPSASAAKTAKALGDALARQNVLLLATLAREPDLPAAQAERSYTRYAPYRVARVKGTFALHQLRLQLGTEPFLQLMRTLHERFQGKTVTTADFLSAARQVTGRDVEPLLRPWLERTGFPDPRPTVTYAKKKGGWKVSVVVTQPDGNVYPLATSVEIETDAERVRRPLVLDGARSTASFDVAGKPRRVVFDPGNDIPVQREAWAVWANLTERWPEALIVHGTSRQDEAQRTLALRFQTTLADAFTEQLIPVVKDCEVTDEALRSRDLVLLGGPRDNSLVARLWEALGTRAPATLGDGYFRFRGDTDADPAHGLFLALPSPFAPDRLVWLFAGNSALALYDMTKANVPGLPAWARFQGDEAESQGYLPVDKFVFAGPGTDLP